MNAYIVTNSKRKTWKYRVKAETSFEARQAVICNRNNPDDDITDWYAVREVR